MNKYMDLAWQKAAAGVAAGAGGPFGACVVKDGQVLAVAHNEVLSACDPTAHAEMVALRQAAKKLCSHDLSGAEIYATGYPCPMCLAAIIWANIDKCYYALPVTEAAEIGFRDELIYRYLAGEKEILSMIHLPDSGKPELYKQYQEQQKTIY